MLYLLATDVGGLLSRFAWPLQEGGGGLSSEDKLLYLLMDLAIIIVAARIMGGVAKRLGQPAVIGEIVAGIMLGPTILGRIDSSWPGEIFPAELVMKGGPLTALADLGLIFFMFLIGLELDSRLLRSQGKRAFQISLSGVILPLLLGIGVGYLIYSVNTGGNFREDITEDPKKFTFALFLGAAMCITAFPVLARVLVETGLYKTPVGTATLTAAAVDDVTAWILLAAVIGLAREGDALQALPTFGYTIVFVAFMFVAVRPAMGLLAKRYDAAGRLTIDQVAVVLAGVLLAALATEWIGIHYIFGAFVFGALMPKRAQMTKEITEKVEDFVVIAMLPVFFTVTGLRTNLFTLDSFSLVGWTLLILAAAVFGKFAGCGIASRLTGSNTKDSVVVGALMNTRGLTELVILSIGLELGVLSDRIFAMMVIMALSTTVMAAPIVNRIYPRERLLKEFAADEEPAVTPTATRILVAIGSPATAPGLVDAAVRLTAGLRPAELLLVKLIPPRRAPELVTGIFDEENEMEETNEAMRVLEEQAERSGVSARTLSFLSSDIGKDLASLAGDNKCAGVVLGWDRTSMPEDTLRVLARRVMSLAPCDVMVVSDRAGRGGDPRPGAPVMLVLTGGSHDEPATAAAVRLASEDGVGLQVLGFASPLEGMDVAAMSRRLAEQASAIHESSGIRVTPHFHENLLEAAVTDSENVSVAVIGTGDDWLVDRRFGSSTNEFMDTLACPVLVVRGAGKIGAPSAEPAAGAAPDWPFITPIRDRDAETPSVPLPAAPHIQRLDPYGYPVEALPVGQAMTIGRAPGNRVVLADDNLVSRSHAAIEQQNGDYVLQDVGSTNGTMLWRDGEWRPVKQEGLKEGDLVVIGANVFRFARGEGK